MAEFPFGSLIGAGTALVGGFLNRAANEDAAEAAANQGVANRLLQTQFAQHGLSWRAQDAMRAYGETGIHPLAMLGVSGPSYTPSNYVGGANTAVGDAVSSAGQGVGRAMDAAASQDQRLAHAGRLDALVTERAGLENELLKMRIASEMQQLKAASNPPMPIGSRWLVDGQGNTTTGLIKDAAMKRTISDPAVRFQEPGAITDRGWARTDTGYQVVPSNDVKQRIEDSVIQETLWFLRNNVLPGIISSGVPPFKAREGKNWEASPLGHWKEINAPRDAREMLNRFKRGW